MIPPKVVLITGAARRIGATVARFLHAQGMCVVVQYRESKKDAHQLCSELNALRQNSAYAYYADLSCMADLPVLMEKTLQTWGYLDVLVNNASAFFPSQVGEIDESHWSTLIDTNLKAPFFLAQLAAPALKKRLGTIINLIDIHGKKPLKNYPVYSISKAGLEMMTYALAKELAPEVRVNGVSPGLMGFLAENENALSETLMAELQSRITLKRLGKPEEIAKAIGFLIDAADYVTGHVLVVDGGRLLNC